MTRILDVLHRVQLFADLNEEDLQKVAAICVAKEIAPGEVIIQQNTTGSELYIIGSGTVEVYISKGADQERSLVLLGNGQVIGEMALIDQGYRSASVKATQKGATLFMIEQTAFDQLCRENTHIGFQVMRNLALDLAFKLRHRNLTAV